MKPDDATLLGPPLRAWWRRRGETRVQLLVYAVLLPLAVFSPLLNLTGLYEHGDADFPLRPFSFDYVLPWHELSGAGADNTFIGLPRMLYYALADVFIVSTPLLQMAQWLWYATFAAVGVTGSLLLARRLGAGRLAPALGVAYAFNLWSYDRIAQGPLFFAYEATPLALWLLLRALEAPSVARALAFALSLWMLLCSFQISVLAALACVAIVIERLVRHPVRTLRALAFIVPAVLAGDAYFLAPALASALERGGSSLNLIASRFGSDVFAGYARNANVLATARLSSFFYASLERQPWIVQVLTFLPPLLILLTVNLKAAWRDRRYAAAMLTILAGLWLVDGFNIVPGFYTSLREHVPGLSFFVEPDYFTPLVILGGFAALALTAAPAEAIYRGWWPAALLTIAAAGVIPFLPVAGAESGLPQTPIPSIYVKFAREAAPERVLLLPDRWVANFRWSPYVLNGFTMLNSPAAAVGPTMLEWTPQDTLSMDAMTTGLFAQGITNGAEAAARVLGVRTVALSLDMEVPSDELDAEQATLNELATAGLATVPQIRSEPPAELELAGLRRGLPMLGLYGASAGVANAALAPATVAAFDQSSYQPLELNPSRPAALELSSAPLSLARFRPAVCDEHRMPGGPLRVDADDPRGGSATACYRAAVPIGKRDRAIALSASVAGESQPALAEIVFTGPGHPPVIQMTTVGGAPSFAIRPSWAARAVAFVHGENGKGVVLKGARIERLAADARARYDDACERAPFAWRHPYATLYQATATLHGRCTLVLRQSHSSGWQLRATGAGRVIRSFEADGFADAWEVEGSGPLGLQIEYVLDRPYFAGLGASFACLLVWLALMLRAFRMPKASRG